MKSYKKQIEEAEEIAALNLAKFRQVQVGNPFYNKFNLMANLYLLSSLYNMYNCVHIFYLDMIIHYLIIYFNYTRSISVSPEGLF